MTAMLIGLAHGLPIFIVGLITKSNVSVLVAALIMGWVALAMGNPAFLGTDLAWIAVGCWLGWTYKQ